MTISFSIIINTYNRAVLLEDAILGLSELDYYNFEVIVVNGPSSDHTEDVLDKWKGKIKIGRCEEPNLSMSRNVGVELASGEVIAFIDDDAVPHPSWLRQLAPHYLNQNVGGVGGFTIDNTGLAYQVRKTICDRFGNAHFPSDFFDERPLSIVGSPFYPSLLGTNSSFRATALREIGGFDHTFAYLLDETDVCLRLVDHGYNIIYEPNALVYHQFAPSHIRSKNKIPKTLYPSAVSKSYFIHKHGGEFSEQRAANELQKYEQEILASNKWLVDHNEITQQHRVSLDDDLLFGIQEGSKRALHAIVAKKGQQGDLDSSKTPEKFLPMAPKIGLTIALVSRSFPPKIEDGIARWTWMMANGLAERGHKVHVITLATPEPFTRYENGYWIHAIEEDQSEDGARVAVQKNIPSG
ncbi:MAG: glycosyltransferase, partial [Candidatus Binatus sp.]|uniref:glycosyltransferase family 2 protein n=1 Tax=Candidatus Binatus sp. TaxID=2811406 RepID=UPI003C70816E